MKTYSLVNTALVINGIEIVGYDEGDDVIKATRAKDSATTKVGADGEMTASFTSDKSGTVTIRLMQTSDSNAFLQALVSAAENGRFIPVAALFKDTVTNETFGGSRGLIIRPADRSRGENAGTMEWMIRLERLDLTAPEFAANVADQIRELFT